MFPEEVNKVLSEYQSWLEAEPECRAAFIAHMGDKMYGHDPLLQAWGWYSAGWDDGYWQDAEITLTKVQNG